jgi:hypothetical protein
MKRDPAAYYVQISYFDCILCHQPVRLSEDRPQRLGCGCISMLASGAPSTIVQELDAFSRAVERHERMWADDAIRLTLKLEPPYRGPVDFLSLDKFAICFDS